MNVNTIGTVQPTSPSFSFDTRANQFNSIPAKPFLATIEGLATGTPDKMIRQSDAVRFVASLSNLQQNRSRIEKLYNNTRIDTRHLTVNLLDESVASMCTSSIQDRMQMYKEHGIPLAQRVAKKALESASVHLDGDLHPESSIEDAIGLIVFVTSTGFVAPGVDAALIDKLKLRRDIARVTVNFMGCAAAMNGIRVASDYVRANPTQKALLVCLELSSVSAVFEDDLNEVIITSIFGDGCAAVVIGACQEEQAISQGKVIIRNHLSYLVEGTTDGIVLGVQDRGITCQLSRQLPDYIEQGVNPIIEGFLARHELKKENIDLWAIHPGGVRIIQRAQSSLGLDDDQVADSWAILQQYGNMLSPSVLFVLERMLLRLEANRTNVQPLPFDALTGVAFSFSPGVGIEGILFQTVL